MQRRVMINVTCLFDAGKTARPFILHILEQTSRYEISRRAAIAPPVIVKKAMYKTQINMNCPQPLCASSCGALAFMP